jgi:hypothetical protein
MDLSSASVSGSGSTTAARLVSRLSISSIFQAHTPTPSPVPVPVRPSPSVTASVSSSSSSSSSDAFLDAQVNELKARVQAIFRNRVSPNFVIKKSDDHDNLYYMTLSECTLIRLSDLEKLSQTTCVVMGPIDLYFSGESIFFSYSLIPMSSSSSSSSSSPFRGLPSPVSSDRQRKRVREKDTERDRSGFTAIRTRLERDFPQASSSDILMLTTLVKAIENLRGNETPDLAAGTVKAADSSGGAGYHIQITGFTWFSFKELQYLRGVFPLHIHDIDISFKARTATIRMRYYSRPSISYVEEDEEEEEEQKA